MLGLLVWSSFFFLFCLFRACLTYIIYQAPAPWVLLWACNVLWISFTVNRLCMFVCLLTSLSWFIFSPFSGTSLAGSTSGCNKHHHHHHQSFMEMVDIFAVGRNYYYVTSKPYICTKSKNVKGALSHWNFVGNGVIESALLKMRKRMHPIYWL